MKNKSVCPGPLTCPGRHSPVAWGQERLCREEACVQSSWVTTAVSLPAGAWRSGNHIPFSKAPETGALEAPALDLGADWEGRKLQAFCKIPGQDETRRMLCQPSSVFMLSPEVSRCKSLSFL